MKNEISVFENKEFGKVRTTEVENKILFCGSDVAKALGYARPNDAVNSHCRATVKRSTPISGKMQEINFITEGDVYRLIVHSKLPSAEKFERWVFDEVLPSIRKHGGYIANQESLSDTEIMARAILLANNVITEKEEKIKSLESKIETMLPKSEFADQILASNDSIDMKLMAKIASKNHISIGRNNLFRFLRESKVLDLQNKPYAEYMNRGWFEVAESTYIIGSKEVKLITSTLVKPKGQIGIIRLLRKAIENKNDNQQIVLLA